MEYLIAEVICVYGSATQFANLTAVLWFNGDSTGGGEHQRLIRQRTHGYSIDWNPQISAVTAGVTLANPAGNGEWVTVDLVAVGITADTWHHVVLTVGTDKVALHVDGLERDTFSFDPTLSSGIYHTGDELTLGNDTPGRGGRRFTGALDEVVLYDRALTLIEIEDHYTSTGRTIPTDTSTVNGSQYAAAVVNSGPLAYWQMDDPNGSLIAADGMNSYDAYVSSNQPDFEQPGAFDQSTAIAFNSRYESLDAPSALLPLMQDSYTIEFWFKTGHTAGVGRFIRGHNYGFGIDWAGQQVHAFAYPGGRAVSLASEPLSLNAWHHVAVTFGNQELTLIINGEIQDVGATRPGPLRMSGTDFTIANDLPTDRKKFVTATIDELAIYDHALTPAEINQHYAASGRMAPIQLDISEAIEACIAQGGNVYLPDPTIAEINGETRTWSAGCYYYDDCDATFNGWAGNAQDWVCENQTELVLAFAASAFAIPTAIVCTASGACAAVAVAAAGQGGAATTATASTAAGAALIALGIINLADIDDSLNNLDTPFYGTIEDGLAPHPGHIERNTESNEPIFIEPVFVDDTTDSNGNPIQDVLDDVDADGNPRAEFCKADSERPGARIPYFAPEQWQHIVDRHLHAYSGSPDNFEDPSQFLRADEIAGVDPDFLALEAQTKRLLVALIYAAYCYGQQGPNPDDPNGHNYIGTFPVNIGRLDTGVEVSQVRLSVDGTDYEGDGVGQIRSATPHDPDAN